ncbi:MAG: DNA polymerase III subunit alpha, partial [Christensenellaceae bacterium]|nr:DNA polymerase III subunit alpha [Christensenellaceae bacterium]
EKEKAYALAAELKEIFGEDFYIELQDHGLLEQRQVFPMLVELAEELGIRTILTNDVHYVRREDAKAQDVLMCIQMNKYVAEDGSLGFGTDQFYLKDGDEMLALAPHLPEALSNTLEIAKKCDVEIEFGKLHLPKFDVPEEYTHEAYLEKLTREGMARKYEDPSVHEDRLQYELNTIYQMGFTDYFLIVQDYVNFARSSDIPVGPGRGSAAGSLVAYALGITNIDPIKYTLLFERFLNPERVSMPDIDMDFCYERRQEVIDYVTRKYGEDRVAQIVTFGTLGARQVVRDVARVMRISVAESDRIAKMVPRELKITLKKALESNAKLRAEYETNPEVKEWLDMAMKLEGMPRHTSTHAAGVIISELPVTEYVPLSKNQKDEAITTQYPMGDLEPLGLLKMDFLGLRTLTVIRDAVDMVREQYGIDIDIDNIDYDDPAVYEMISRGSTDGVFQLESEGMRSLMMQLRPENLGDVMVGISLFRPGPMAKIPDYIAGKNDRESVHYAHPILEKDLSETYGCMVYQEQVMELVRDMAGYSLARSDLVRRAMAKKKQDVMEHERKIFVYGGDGVDGAIKRGVPEAVAQDVFDQMMDFAQYAFNKSHACAYAVVSYQTAYLKHYYPKEFMTALLNSFITNSDKLAHYMRYIVSEKIPLLPPDINRSQKLFAVENDGIRFGLYAIKNVGDAISGVITEREINGDYEDLQDFIVRNASVINKTQIESLILSGCFDGCCGHRAQLMAAYDGILRNAQEKNKRDAIGQMSLFDFTDEGRVFAKVTLPDVPEYDHRQMLAYEKDKTGLYISGHPLQEYSAYLGKQKETVAHILEAEHDLSLASRLEGRMVDLIGIVSSAKVRTTKQSRQQMMNAVLEDMTGSIGIILFPKVFMNFGDVIVPDRIVKISGRVMINEEGPPELNIERASVFKPTDMEYIGKKLFVRIPTEDITLVHKLKEILRRYPGDQPTRLFVADTRKQYFVSGREAVLYSDALINELKAQFGEENVVLK